MNLPEAVHIPYPTYQNLLDHLQIHATTDSWAEALLTELEAEAKPVVGNRVIDSNNGKRKLIERSERED
ncbi:MAG: hypothetical protein ACRDEA_14220 [Microcystaceae cyanobacterium]